MALGKEDPNGGSYSRQAKLRLQIAKEEEDRLNTALDVPSGVQVMHPLAKVTVRWKEEGPGRMFVIQPWIY